jgi:two-component system, cell cycle sensor histidine kinase and response regulator CckA
MANDLMNTKFENAIEQARSIRENAIPGIDIQGDISLQAIDTLLETLEELHVAQEELTQANEELIMTRNDLEEQKNRYKNLFDRTPYGYLVTDTLGVIEEANQTSSSLLNYATDHLVGKPLSVFIHPDEIPEYRKQLNHLPQKGLVFHWMSKLMPREKAATLASFTLQSEINQQGEVSHLRWLIRDRSRQIEQRNSQNSADETSKRDTQTQHDLDDLLTSMVDREIRLIALEEVIVKLRSQVRAAGLTPVADDPFFEDEQNL